MISILRTRGWIVAIIFGAAVLARPCVARDEDWPQDDLIHSDLPLFADYTNERLWPQHFSSDEDGGSFGCASRVAFGDWAFVGAGEDVEPAGWFRFTNYGVFHCYAIIGEADDREDLDEARRDYGFFVELGEVSRAGQKVELWAIQLGSRPGSDYLLLAREADGGGLIERFELLQRACPSDRIRDAGSIDISSTRYCSINTRDELLKLAKRMVNLKPIGTIALAPKNEGPSETPGPAEVD